MPTEVWSSKCLATVLFEDQAEDDRVPSG